MNEEELAAQVVDLARAQVLAKNHFLSSAVGRLGLEPAVLGEQFVTDGYVLRYDAGRVLRAFRETRESPQHDLLHSVVHCLFLHPYVGPSVNRRFWDLACDIVAERVAAELIGPRKGARGAQIATLAGAVERDLSCRASAERIYARLCEGAYDSQVDEWTGLVHSDDHTAWYAFRGSEGGDGSAEGDSREGGFKLGDCPEGRGDGCGGQVAGDPDGEPPDGGDGEGGWGGSGGALAGTEPAGDGAPPHGGTGTGSAAGDVVATELLERQGALLRWGRPSRAEQMEAWRQTAIGLFVNLQTMSAKQRPGVEGFSRDLEAASRKREDYASFLRQFAVMGEVMRLSEDEFDTIFYTYGMKLYGNLPLIEPLEFREEKRVREFVIAVDTSGSVSGDTVKRFMETTFDILRSTESFFEKVHLRVLECDARVQSDDRIDSLSELEEWSRELKVYGCGGTDFRPVFEYTDALVEAGEFCNLGGLVYFTDGKGEYPDWIPSYRTAFIFYGDDCRPEDAPPWAVQMTMEPGSLEQHAREGV